MRGTVIITRVESLLRHDGVCWYAVKISAHIRLFNALLWYRRFT